MSKQEVEQDVKQDVEQESVDEQQIEQQEQASAQTAAKPKVKKRRSIKLFTNLQLIILSTVIFAAIMIFFDSNNIYVKSELEHKIVELKRVRDSLTRQITADSIIIVGVESDDKFLERYAREHFYMRREGEETFIVKLPERDTTTNVER